MNHSWQIITAWLSENAPQILQRLHGPAEASALDALEAQCGQTLPQAFKDLYLQHDGADISCGVLIGIQLMPLEKIAYAYEMWADFADDQDLIDDLSEGISSSPDGAVQPLYSHRGWVPFGGDSQNMVALDFAPGPQGVVGQVINCGRDDEIRYAIAPSFEEFLAFLARQFSGGRVAVRDDLPEWLRLKEHDADLLTGLDRLLEADRS